MQKNIITRSEAIEMMVDADIMSLTADVDNLKDVLLRGWGGYSYMSAIKIMETYNDMFGNSTVIKECVGDFISYYGTKVKENESSDYVDLMMDDHKCVEFEGQQFYIPNSNNTYVSTDFLIDDYLIENYQYNG